jgi:hypothetical protein
MDKKPIELDSLRGRIFRRVCIVLAGVESDRAYMEKQAKEQGLPLHALTAAMLTEAILEFIPGEG